jgi:hypothetical protein
MTLHDVTFQSTNRNNNYYNDNSYNKLLVSFVHLVDRLSIGTELYYKNYQ